MNKKVNKEFIIGVTAVVAIFILYFGINYLKGQNLFKSANYYIVEYDNVAGLEHSAPVMINGYKVGQVREIEIDYAHPGKIKVELALNKDLKLPSGSRAELASTLLSGAFINIRLGNGSDIIPVGSELPTYVAPDLMSSLQDDILPSVSAVMPKVDSILYNINRLIGDPALLQSVQRLDGITNNALLMTDGLQRQINSNMPGIMADARHTATNLDTISANLALLSRELRALPLQSTMDNVNQLTANLEQFSSQLNDKNSTLGQLTTNSEVYDRLNTVVADIDSLIVDIKKNPKRYISIKLL